MRAFCSRVCHFSGCLPPRGPQDEQDMPVPRSLGVEGRARARDVQKGTAQASSSGGVRERRVCVAVSTRTLRPCSWTLSFLEVAILAMVTSVLPFRCFK